MRKIPRKWNNTKLYLLHISGVKSSASIQHPVLKSAKDNAHPEFPDPIPIASKMYLIDSNYP